MLYFTISMTFAGLFAAFPVLTGKAWAGMLPACLWAGFPFLLPFLEQKESGTPKTTGYMREVLLRLAGKTLTFFETVVTENEHHLPPESIQIEPAAGICHCTSPDTIGLYLCSLIAASRMELLKPEEAARRIDETLCSLESLSRWEGLFYSRYRTKTLEPESQDEILSKENGILAVCLLACAQSMRTLMPLLSAAYRDLPLRLDRICTEMLFEKLYDEEAGLFYKSYHPVNGKPSGEHHELLASESRLMSYVSIMLGKVPAEHWRCLHRPRTRGGVLLSRTGGMQDYLMPLLFLPLPPQTLLYHSCRRVITLQKYRRYGGAFGIARSWQHSFDDSGHYQTASFGLPWFALESDLPDKVIAPYASMLCLPLQPKAAFRNLQRLQRLGLEGPLGLFEAVDFDPRRTKGKPAAVVRGYISRHQCMILCAICNTLCENYMASLFSDLPRAQAHRLLLEEPHCQKS